MTWSGAFTRHHLKDAFKITDLGHAKIFLGMEITRDRTWEQLVLSHVHYSNDVLGRFGTRDTNPRQIPMRPVIKILKNGDAQDSGSSEYGYSKAVGTLTYLACCARPDISQSVGALARYMAAPKKQHWELPKGVLRYLVRTQQVGICS
jgi:hypothetical protein